MHVQNTCRKSHKLWSFTKTSTKVEERGSDGKAWDECVYIQFIIQPSLKRLVYFSTLCAIQKHVLSFSPSSCQQRTAFTRETVQHCSRISTDSCYPTQHTSRLSTINHPCSVMLLLVNNDINR